MMSRLIAALALSGAALPAYASSKVDTDYFTPRLAVGEHVSNVFSIATSLKADGFDERVRRNSGSADYTLVKASPDTGLTFAVVAVYDGQPRHQGQADIRDGGMTQCAHDQCQTATDASGPVFNRLLWGAPPASLKDGMTWQVTIDRPWELGPAGTQTVTVVHVDETAGAVTLKREGDATGAFADEPATVSLERGGKTVTLSLTPGQAHWTGYTTFRHGVVISDELLVDRKVQLQSAETGPLTATQRRYMMLNAAPYPTLPE